MTVTGMNWKKYDPHEPVLDEEEGKFYQGITVGETDNGFLFHYEHGTHWMSKRMCPRAYANEEATVEVVFIPRWLLDKEPALGGK